MGELYEPSGELTFCHGKSPFLMGKSTISMAIFHCYVKSPEGNPEKPGTLCIHIIHGQLMTTGLSWAIVAIVFVGPFPKLLGLGDLPIGCV